MGSNGSDSCCGGGRAATFLGALGRLGAPCWLDGPIFCSIRAGFERDTVGGFFSSTFALDASASARSRCCFVMNLFSTTSKELTPGGGLPKMREQRKQYPCSFTNLAQSRRSQRISSSPPRRRHPSASPTKSSECSDYKNTLVHSPDPSPRSIPAATERRVSAAAAAGVSSSPSPVAPTASYSASCCSNTFSRTLDPPWLSTPAAARLPPSHRSSTLPARAFTHPRPIPLSVRLRRHVDPSLRQSRAQGVGNLPHPSPTVAPRPPSASHDGSFVRYRIARQSHSFIHPFMHLAHPRASSDSTRVVTLARRGGS